MCDVQNYNPSARQRKTSNLPTKKKANLVERDDEGRALRPQEVEALDRLRLEPVHQVHHEDGDVAEGAAPGAEVGEGLVAGGVDHQHARQLHVHLHRLVQLRNLVFIDRLIDLLC